MVSIFLLRWCEGWFFPWFNVWRRLSFTANEKRFMRSTGLWTPVDWILFLSVQLFVRCSSGERRKLVLGLVGSPLCKEVNSGSLAGS